MSAINIADFLQFDPNAKEFWHVALFLFALLVLYRMITNGDFAARVLGIGVILFGLWFLSGCSNGPTDPLGATSRTRLRTDASVSIAQADANARIAQAQAEQAARISEANALIITEQSKLAGAPLPYAGLHEMLRRRCAAAKLPRFSAPASSCLLALPPPDKLH